MKVTNELKKINSSEWEISYYFQGRKKIRVVNQDPKTIPAPKLDEIIWGNIGQDELNIQL